jgi:hypothetical protein
MSLRAPQWLLPLLAVVLTFGGGPMAWAKLVPPAAAAARIVTTETTSQAAPSAHCSEAEQGGSGSDHTVPAHTGDGRSGDGEDCCAAGSCHCACPTSLSGQLAPLRGAHETPAAPADAVRTLHLESRPSRLLRPPIS